MTIEWNKVTWYSKFLAIVIFVTTFALAFYLGVEYGHTRALLESASTVPVSPHNVTFGPVNLKVGDEKRVGKDLHITLTRVVEDSRCPVGVQCVWAGRVRVEVELASGDQKETRESVTDTEPVIFKNYKIDIISIKPEPISGEQILDANYEIGFRVTLIQ